MSKKETSKNIWTADVIAEWNGKIVLIERQKFPFGLALPGGHVDPGERPRKTAIREMREETGLELSRVRFITRRRGKHRDPRYAMSQTCVYSGIASGTLRDEEGFTKVVFLTVNEILRLPRERFAFDHHKILMQFFGK